MCLDTGCVFGGRLTALRYPEREVVSVPAERVYYEPARPFPVNPAASDAPQPAHREPEVLDIGDVTGRRVIETAYLRRIGVREENAAAALEVMSRFAIDPRWLLYLPPTMSPVATSARPDLLEHPDQAFDAYRAEGVGQVVCEEKHMGSRAVALVCRDLDAARARFGAPGDALGAVWTRTGRPFFDESLTARLIDRIRAAAEAAGLFDELGTGWLLLDAELLPWSAKAGQLLRDQYAAVGRGRPHRAARRRVGARAGGRGRTRRVRPAGADPVAERQRGRLRRRLPALPLGDRRPGRGPGGPVPAARLRGRRAPGEAARLAPRRGRPPGRGRPADLQGHPPAVRRHHRPGRGGGGGRLVGAS